MTKLLEALKPLAFIIIGMIAMAAWLSTKIPDQKVESYGDTCIPIYYSGLECCKK
jgi:hypothetical protein